MHDAKYASALLLIKEVLEDGSILKDSKEEGILYGELSAVYNELKNYDEAIIAANKSIEIGERYASSGDDSFNFDSYAHFKLQSLWVLVNAYRLNKVYDKAIGTTNTIFQFVEDIKNREGTSSHGTEWIVPTAYMKRSQIYGDMNDLHHARIDLDSAKNNYSNMMFDFTRGTYMLTEADYYNKKGEYKTSLEYIDKGLAIIGEDKLNLATAIGVYSLKSKSLHHLGKDADAYELLTRIVQKKDSLDNKLMSSQMAEIQTIYEVNKIEAAMKEQAAQMERIKVIVVALLAVSILLLILIVNTKRNKKEKESKNKKMHEQHQLMKSYLGQIRFQRMELQLAREVEANEYANWAEKAYHYLIDTEAFKKEDLSRDDLAIALGTNRQYLIDAIKAETGKTFKDYINSIRIEYAYEMLIKDWGANVENIYIAAGFTTRSTFNRLFREQYGMNPIELREVVKQKEKHIITQIENVEE